MRLLLFVLATANAFPVRRTLPAVPTDFDVRDGATCRAFDARSQGACKNGASYAAASALGMRLCLLHGQDTSLTIQPDCSTRAEAAARLFLTNATVDEACTGACAQYAARAVTNVSQYQYELLAHGPGVVSLDVYSDFAAYRSGVYSPAVGATLVSPGHSVVLVGWGVDNAVPYWTIQNSYGAWWGEGGYARIKRGTAIEAYGMVSIQPQPPAACACPHNTVAMGDCSCSPCLNQWTGPDCDLCPRCASGGTMLANCTCICPKGVSGALCEINPRLQAAQPAQQELRSQGFAEILNFTGSGGTITVPKLSPGTVKLCYYMPEFLATSTRTLNLCQGPCTTMAFKNIAPLSAAPGPACVAYSSGSWSTTVAYSLQMVDGANQLLLTSAFSVRKI